MMMQQIQIPFVPALLFLAPGRIFAIETKQQRNPFDKSKKATCHYYDDKGSIAIWDETGLTIKSDGTQEEYKTKQQYQIGGKFEEYMKLVYESMWSEEHQKRQEGMQFSFNNQ